MKNNFFSIVIGMFFLFFLSSCKNPSLTYEYLMQHPFVLQKEMMNCQLSFVNNVQCDVVKRAANDFSLLVSERQGNPEQFGEKILRAQQLLVVRFQELKDAQKKSSSEKVLQQAEKSYQIQLSNVEILLAVIKMTSVLE